MNMAFKSLGAFGNTRLNQLDLPPSQLYFHKYTTDKQLKMSREKSENRMKLKIRQTYKGYNKGTIIGVTSSSKANGDQN